MDWPCLMCSNYSKQVRLIKNGPKLRNFLEIWNESGKYGFILYSFTSYYKKRKKRKRLNRDSQGLRTPRDGIKRIFTTIFLVK